MADVAAADPRSATGPRFTAVLTQALRRLLLIVVAALGVGATLMPPSARAEDEATLERRIKAASIFKFAGYVHWPDSAFASPSAPMAIGVLGDDAMFSELAQVVAGRAVESRPLAIRRIRSGESLAGLHILFIGRGERARLADLRAMPAQPVLVITEHEGALEQGSIINFVLAGGYVRFDVALDNADRRGLKLSARLLTVANFVRMVPGQ